MSAVTTQERQTPVMQRRYTPPWSDIVISGAVLVITTAALLATIGWPTAAALFPRIASIIGIVCSAGHLLTILIQKLRTRSTSSKTTSEADRGSDKDAEDRVDVEYVFATAGTKAWLRALGWIGSFLIMIYLFGIFISGAILALFYLRYGASRSWIFAALYSASLTVFLWGLFDQFLQAALPRGVFGLL